jgi:hypothetical protein
LFSYDGRGGLAREGLCQVSYARFQWLLEIASVPFAFDLQPRHTTTLVIVKIYNSAHLFFDSTKLSHTSMASSSSSSSSSSSAASSNSVLTSPYTRRYAIQFMFTGNEPKRQEREDNVDELDDALTFRWGFNVEVLDQDEAKLKRSMSVEEATAAVEDSLFEWVYEKVPEYQNREFMKDVVLIVTYHGHGGVYPRYGDYSDERLVAYG